MEKKQTGTNMIIDVLIESQEILNNYFAVLEATVNKFIETKEQAMLGQGMHLTLPESNSIKDVLRKHNKTSKECIQKLSNYAEVLSTVKCKLSKSLRHFNPDEAPTKVKYLSGDPWNLILVQTPSQNKEIEQFLMKMHNSNKLENVTDVEMYDVVCVHEGRLSFRAVVVDVLSNNRISVLNVDKNYRKLVLLKNVYELPSQMIDIPIQVIQCNLLPMNEELKSFWCKDASELFLSVTSDSNLSVTLIEQTKAEMPPVFSVQMISEFNGVQVDVNLWLTNTVLPVLKSWNKTPPSCKEVNVLFPFNDNTPVPESKKLMPTKKARSFKSGKSSPKIKPTKAASVCPNYNYSKSDVPNLPSDSDPEVKSIFCDTPSVKAAIVMSNDNEDISVLKHYENDYQPKDETEYCHLYLRNKRCWKANCKKLHKPPTGKWTDDKLDTFCSITNRVMLPKLLEKVTLKVVTIFSSNSFYVYLHPDYSNIGEIDDVNSLKNLQQDINSLENVKKYRSYTVDPSLGEILLVQDDTQGFKRAKVVETFDNFAYVFLIDYGLFETVPLPKIRKIEQQFLHLPAQAIYTTLENTSPVPEKADQAKAFLKLKLEGKMFEAKVFRRSVADSELSVELYLDNSTCLNQLLLDKGFCKNLS